MDLREVATWFETEYWKEMDYPSMAQACKFSGLNKIQLGLLEEKINNQLEARGLPPVGFEVPQKVNKIVDPMFAAACALILDTLDKRSAAAKLKAIGLSTMKFNTLKEVPINKKYYQARVNQVFKGAEDTAKLGLVKNVETGDLQSIKYFNEVSGVYRPNQEILLNLGILIGSMMEILAELVDSKTLSIVSERLELLMNQQVIETSSRESNSLLTG